MAFDIDALLSSPGFQSGFGLLGAGMGSQPMMQAYQVLQQQAQQKQQAEQRKQATEQHQQMMEYRRSQMELQRQQAMQYGEQIRQSQRKNDLAEQQQAAINKALEAFHARRGGSATQPRPLPDVPPTMQPQAAPPVGKHGTPQAILDNLEQVESGGNPLAIGPDIGGGVKALGAYQFLPSTINMLKKQGITFDPFKREQARDAADFYIQSLVKEHGGDYAKALAAYGGFKTKDATSYVGKVLKGTPEQQARQMQQIQAAQQTAASDPFAQYREGLEMAGTVRALSGDVGGIKDMAEASKPTVVAPGQTVYGPDGATTVPDPQGQARIAAQHRQAAAAEERARVAGEQVQIDRDKETRLARDKQLEHNKKLATDQAAFDSVSKAADRALVNVDELVKHPGRKAATGTSGLLNFAAPVMAGSDRKQFLVELKSLESKAVNDTLQAVRHASENGASGYGQFTVQEMEVIKTYVANLDPLGDEEGFLKGLQKVRDYMADIKARAARLYEQSTGKKPRTVTRTGKTKDGRRAIEYSDGSIEYGN